MAYFRTPPRIPTRVEVDACLAVTDTADRARDHILVAMAAMTGLRVHEMVALSWGQVITGKGTVRHRVELRPENTKGNVGGDIVLGEKLRWKITRYRTWCIRQGLPVGEDDPMFTSRHHRRMTVRRVQQVWKAVQAQAGIVRPYKMHALRHFYGTSVYSATKDIRLTQVAMRHQAVSSTMIYTHVSERDVERAIEGLF